MTKIFALMMIAIVLCGSALSQEARPSKVGTAPVELPETIKKLTRAALSGDGDAAAKLSDYYRYEKNKDSKWEYWALVAAENGDPGSQFDEYNILTGRGDQQSQLRALYWLKKSAKSGYSYATLELKRCYPSGEIESKSHECSVQ